MTGLEALPGIIRGLVSHHVPTGPAGTAEPRRGLCWVCPSWVPRADALRACRARHECWDRSAPCLLRRAGPVLKQLRDREHQTSHVLPGC